MTEQQTIDPQRLRQVLGHYPTGVTVVTAVDEDGEPTGMVLGSFTSVSLDPPLVAYLPQKSSSSYARLRASRSFCVNVLSADQEELCRSFASRHTRHTVEADTRPGITGVPVLSDALAYLECRIDREVDGGDHVIVIGEVIDLAVQREEGPLTFFRNTFHRLPAAS